MQIIQDIETIKEPFKSAVITIGNFDGVHIGHQALFHEVIERAEAMDGTAIAMTFEPHPIRVLKQNGHPPLITLYDQKVELIEKSGIDVLIAVTNNDAVNMMACLIADRFGIPRKIARVRSTEWGGENSFMNNEDLKIDLIIHPEELAAQEIFRLVKLRAGNDIIDVAEGQIQVMATRIHENSPLAYRKLKDISKEYREFPFRVVAVAREQLSAAGWFVMGWHPVLKLSV